MKVSNKQARRNYTILDKFEAGINLNGAEVKAIKMGHADLTGSFVRIMGSEAYLINAKIFPYQPGQVEGYDQHRTRKLLMHKKEIISLTGKSHLFPAQVVRIRPAPGKPFKRILLDFTFEKKRG